METKAQIKVLKTGLITEKILTDRVDNPQSSTWYAQVSKNSI